jgi:hypothetical protein
MAAESMLSPRHAILDRQRIYVYGLRAWWSRAKLLLVYTVALLLLLAVGSSFQSYLADGTIDSFYALIRTLLLCGMWVIALVTAWRRGNTKVSRIDYLPDSQSIDVRTINFLTRTLPLSALRRVEYQDGALERQQRGSQRIVLYFRNTLPIEVDTHCARIDQALFQQLFPRQQAAPVSTPLTP